MAELLFDSIIDAAIDSIKILPFLFLTYLVMEYVEHKMGENSKDIIRKSGKFGPILGAVCGAVPQCGFSAAASNLYAGRIITRGTLLAIYLSTSDEMLPILISEHAPVMLIAKTLGLKIIIGLAGGLLVDIIWAKHQKIRAYAQKPHKGEKFHIDQICENENCKCDDGILKSALKHTLHIFLFILLFSFLFNICIAAIGRENIESFILGRPVAGVFLTGIIGLIPNCAASVMITSLYLEGLISFGAMMAGLLVGAGVGLLVLCRVNEDVKDNLLVIGLLYVCGILGGIIIEILGIG
ncbi:MAG: arsenic efflux protein [Lachnospiraceae bacterium]|nr:arsenic efflux protein [Lachnospiraceae bacterium]